MVGTVIKAGGSGRMIRQLRPVAMKDHMADAQRTIEEARLTGARIINNARKEIERQREEQRQRGYETGFAEGRKVGEQTGHEAAFESAMADFKTEQESLLAAMRSVIDEFERSKEELLIRARHDVLVLAVAIAERVTKRVGAIDPTVVVANAENAIDRITSDSDIVIQVHPGDMSTMTTYAESLAQSLRRKQHVNVVENDQIERGGCIVTCGKECLDATIAGQLQQATALLLGTEAVGDEKTAEHNQP